MSSGTQGQRKYIWGLNFNQETLAVSIADNGQGMSSFGPPMETGLGLRGMDERTKLLKGSLIIESQPGRGTKIVLLVPNLLRVFVVHSRRGLF